MSLELYLRNGLEYMGIHSHMMEATLTDDGALLVKIHSPEYDEVEVSYEVRGDQLLEVERDASSVTESS